MELKTPLSYYGGKQNLLTTILPLIPPHVTYVEPFVGGGAIFWNKPPSEVEVINDTNRELINFYEVTQNDFVDLEKYIRITLHSRSQHNDANVIYHNPHLFSRIQRAWAVWVLAIQSFSGMLDGSWGYDRSSNTMGTKIQHKREGFTIRHAMRLQNVQIECTDALRIIRSRDSADTFVYGDPPYYNSDCGHYDGYSREDFERLLATLGELEGKFLLSSYPSDILQSYTRKYGWSSRHLEQTVTVAVGMGAPAKKKIEMLTANYDLDNPSGQVLRLFN